MMSTEAPPLVLASTSASRQAVLRAAGIAFEAVAPHVDEDEIKTSLKVQGAPSRVIADALAEAKAVKVSRRMPGALVLGCDQILDLGRGQMLDKADTLEQARAHLQLMSGREHRLLSAAVIAQDGQPVWRFIDSATLLMRSLSPAFIDQYLAAEGEAILGSVGCYRMEGLGIQLFARVSGNHFTILGLPLLALLDYLRVRQVLPS